jgi:hypothetical protein
MDKVLEIVIAVTVFLMVAVVVMAMMSGRAGNFDQWLGDRQGNASCSLYKTQYQTACNCGGSPVETEDAIEAKDKAESANCGWPGEFRCGDEVCG